MRKTIFILTLLLLQIQSVLAVSYPFDTVPNDPIGVKMYELENGLKVYLSVNKDKPRIQTMITVKTGSKNDPADVTGLAHYLEHMLFKGTSKFGTKNWEKEKVLLKEISDLYEAHKAEKDEKKKDAIYAQIDSVSNIAAQYAIANEYDKMMEGLGAKGTNAFTSLERTAYINDIPATELEKWLKLESERFSELVLRLFHTELEAVYEEFNRGQDNDYNKVYHAMNKALFPTHPYGTQTTIGEGEHLKNPSMVKIHEYFNKYYVPNNMAIALAGDFDPNTAVELIEKYFGQMTRKEVNPPTMPKEAVQQKNKETEVYGPMGEWVSIGVRLDGYNSKDAIMAELLSSVLYNGQAGLIDLNLMQKQKILKGTAYSQTAKDYTKFSIQGNPKEGQSLEEVKNLLLTEINNVKEGNFDEELITLVVKNNKKDELAQFEANWLRSYVVSDAFVMDADWADYVDYYDRMGQISKEDLMKWTNEKIQNNLCIVYKRNGVDSNIVKVDKPNITPVEIDRESKSEFYQEFEQMESLRLTPEFIDFKESLKQKDLAKDIPMYYVNNSTNDLFSLYIELDETLENDKKVALALGYLNYLGTNKYSPEKLKLQFYKLAVDFSAKSRGSVYVSLSGLNSSFKESVALVEHLIKNCEPNNEALSNYIADIKKKREDAKKNKGTILYSGVMSYAKYGTINKFNDQLTNDELDAISAQELVEIIHGLLNYKHSIFYYGKTPFDQVYSEIKEVHQIPTKLTSVNNPKEYEEIPLDTSIVYFVDYDMVQTEMIMLSKGKPFTQNDMAKISMFNSYFGSGLSSIVFQEIREAQALAYSANARMTIPTEKDKSHYLQAYVGTQVNKLHQAVDAMLQLMNEMPKAEIQFKEAKIAALKKIESDRIIKTGIYWSYRAAEKRGIDYDYRKPVYEQIKKLTLSDIDTFFNQNVASKTFVYCVIGRKADMDMEALEKLGKVKELSLEEIFGY